MQFKLLTLASLVALTTANPIVPRAPLCSGSQTPQCCQLDVLGIADVTCKNVPGNPQTKDAFAATCAESGATSMCCTLTLATIGLICSMP